jgi:hypothetical protein
MGVVTSQLNAIMRIPLSLSLFVSPPPSNNPG